MARHLIHSEPAPASWDDPKGILAAVHSIAWSDALSGGRDPVYRNALRRALAEAQAAGLGARAREEARQAAAHALQGSRGRPEGRMRYARPMGLSELVGLIPGRQLPAPRVPPPRGGLGDLAERAFPGAVLESYG